MPSFNKVLLMGNLTRDPQIKHLPSNVTLVEFGMACNRKFKTQSGEQREEVTFVDCVAYGRAAEVIGQYCQKGKQLFVEGRLKFDQWDDKMGGGRRSKLSVVVENFQFIGGNDSGGERSGRPQQSRQPQGNSAPPSEPQDGDQQGHFTDDDIPF